MRKILSADFSPILQYGLRFVRSAPPSTSPVPGTATQQLEHQIWLFIHFFFIEMEKSRCVVVDYGFNFSVRDAAVHRSIEILRETITFAFACQRSGPTKILLQNFILLSVDWFHRMRMNVRMLRVVRVVTANFLFTSSRIIFIM